MANLEKGSTSGGYNILTSNDLPNILPKSGSSVDTTSLNVNNYVKVATVNITSQYQQSYFSMDVFSGNNSGINYQSGLVYFRVKQQSALGSAPVVNLTLSNPIGMSINDVVAVLSKNDSTSTVIDLYVKINFSYDKLKYQTRYVRYPEILTFYDGFNNGGFVSSVPTGIAHFNCVLSDGTFNNLTMNGKNVLTTNKYTTSNVGPTNNQYALIGTLTFTSQYQMSESLISFMGGQTGNSTNIQRGLLFFRAKQQLAMGSTPFIEMYLMNQNNFAPTDVVAILTSNTSSQTVIQLYVKINSTYEQLYFNPLHEIGSNETGGVSFAWANQSSLITSSGSLPSGTQSNAILQSGVDGNATINATTTSVIVTHNLGYTPTTVTLGAQGNLGSIWWGNQNGTTFTIYCSTAPASNTGVTYRAK